MANVFSVAVFFIVFRESLEASVIISVLLAFAKQGLGSKGSEDSDPRLYKRLVKQIWIGSALGIFICLCIGGGFIGAFYTLGKDIWASSEDLWEGVFSVIATIMITMMGLAMLRVNKMKEKWRIKIAKAILDNNDRKNFKGWRRYLPLKHWSKKYAMALLPFITTLREGVEAIVFVGGVSLGTPATAFPIAVIAGLCCGVGVGCIIYFGGNMLALQYFLIASTCFLYLISAGLWSRAIWYFQMYVFSKQAGGDVAENGSGPGSYNIRQSVWHVNCCNPETDGGWEIFNALLGWQNSATYGSVISYNIYWIFIICVILALIYEEKHGGLPFVSRFIKRKNDMPHEDADELVRRAQQHYTANANKERGITTGSTDDIELGHSTSESVEGKKKEEVTYTVHHSDSSS